MSEFLYYMEIPVDKLLFGVSRPYSWWEEHPKQKKIFEKNENDNQVDNG